MKIENNAEFRAAAKAANDLGMQAPAALARRLIGDGLDGVSLRADNAIPMSAVVGFLQALSEPNCTPEKATLALLDGIQKCLLANTPEEADQ